MPRYYESSPAEYSVFSGNIVVDSLLGGVQWTPGIGTTTLTVSFPWLNGANAFFDYSGEVDVLHGGVTAEQRSDILSAFQSWANVANITFVAVEEDAEGNVGDIRFAFTEEVGEWWGYAYYPSGWSGGGDIWVHTDYMDDDFGPGTYEYYSTVHEIGHALGLDHSFDGDFVIPTGFDDRRYTVMSYTDPEEVWWFNQATQQYDYLITGPGVFDIAAIQYLYGANTSYHAGDDTYVFHKDQPFIQAIWDAGGNDTIDLSDFVKGCTIDLNPGSHSTTAFDNSEVTKNLGIAFGCTIENVVGGSGNDHVTGNAAANLLSGGAGDDWLFGGEGNDTLRGQDGKDTLDGGAGANRLDGGAGDDLLVNGFADYGSAAAAVDVNLELGVGKSREANDVAAVGTDQLNGLAGVYGSKYNDLLKAGATGSSLHGQSGNDQLTGGIGADLLDGGIGDDVLNGGGGSDTASYLTASAAVSVNLLLGTAQNTGGAGIDTLLSIENLTGSKFGDTLRGSAGVNVLIGGLGDDYLYGGDGNDELTGGAGLDRLYGGIGNDSYIVSDLTDYAYENAGEGTDTVLSSVDLTLRVNVENLTLTGGAHLTGRGNELGNVITGNGGANSLLGFAGDDRLIGGAGNDRLTGGEGYDRMYGGTGNDIYYVSDSSDFAYEESGAGTDTVQASVTCTLRANIERLTLTGTDAINGSGNDLANILTGNAGANVLSGLVGNDKLYGGLGADHLSGGDGSDWLEGGADRDRFVGGNGNDRFAFRDGDFAGLTAATCDQIHDYNYAEGDRIHLSAVDANLSLDGDQAFLFIGSAAFSNTAGQLRFEQISGNTYVSGDTNGDGTADFLIRLDGLHGISASDFIL